MYRKRHKSGTISTCSKSDSVLVGCCLFRSAFLAESTRRKHPRNQRFFAECKFESVRIHAEKIVDTIVMDCESTGYSVENCDFFNLALESFSQRLTQLMECHFHTIAIRSSLVYGLISSKTRFVDVGLVEIRLSVSHLESSRFHGGIVNHCRIESSTFKESSFCSIVFRSTSFTGVQFISCEFFECTFIDCQFESVKFDECKIDSCLFYCCAGIGDEPTILSQLFSVDPNRVERERSFMIRAYLTRWAAWPLGRRSSCTRGGASQESLTAFSPSGPGCV